jgi:hypothetical protein
VQKDAACPNSEDGLSISVSKFNKIDARSLIEPHKASIGVLELSATFCEGPSPVTRQNRIIDAGDFRLGLGGSLKLDFSFYISNVPVGVAAFLSCIYPGRDAERHRKSNG